MKRTAPPSTATASATPSSTAATPTSESASGTGPGRKKSRPDSSVESVSEKVNYLLICYWSNIIFQIIVGGTVSLQSGSEN